MQWKRYAIYAILLISLIVRLYGINDPYTSHWQWKQYDYAQVARNFHNEGFNLFRPQLDYFGPGHKVAEFELQVTTYLTAFLYLVFGIEYWVGRIFPIIFSILSIFYLYRLVRLYETEDSALISAFVFSMMPLYIYFSRSLTSDSFMILMSIMSIYYLSRYLEDPGWKLYLLAMISISLCFLSKIIMVFMLVPLSYLILRKAGFVRPHMKKLMILLFPLVLWASYYIYIHYASDIHLIPYDLDGLNWSSPVRIWSGIIAYRPYLYLIEGILTLSGTLLLMHGLLLKKQERVFTVWFLSILACLIALGSRTVIHDYYFLPLAPPAAYIISVSIKALSQKKVFSFALILLMVALSFKTLPPYYDNSTPYLQDYGKKIGDIIPDGSVVQILNPRKDNSPAVMYYTSATGRYFTNHETVHHNLVLVKAEGIDYIILMEPKDPRTYPEYLSVLIRNHKIYEDPNYIVCRI